MTFATFFTPKKNLLRATLTEDRFAEIASRLWALGLFIEADEIVSKVGL